MQTIRYLFLQDEPLVEDAIFDSVLAPRELRIQLADGTGDAERTFIWRPTDEFEWTERKHAEDIANAFDEDHPFHDSAMEVLDGSDATRSSLD